MQRKKPPREGGGLLRKTYLKMSVSFPSPLAGVRQRASSAGPQALEPTPDMKKSRHTCAALPSGSCQSCAAAVYYHGERGSAEKENFPSARRVRAPSVTSSNSVSKWLPFSCGFT